MGGSFNGKGASTEYYDNKIDDLSTLEQKLHYLNQLKQRYPDRFKLIKESTENRIEGEDAEIFLLRMDLKRIIKKNSKYFI